MNRQQIKLVGRKGAFKPKTLKTLTKNSEDLDTVPDYIDRLPGLGIPDRLYANLVYDQDQLAVVSASTSGAYNFSGNSCFDPDTSGIGHQPLYFDQFSQMYNRYRVHKSQIVVELLNSTIASHITITPTTDGTWPATLRTALESNYTASMPISSSVFRMVKDRSISTKKIFGMQSITQDDLYQSVCTTSPSRQWYWRIMGESFDGVTNVSIRVNVRIVYEVEFFERFPIGPSLTSNRGTGMKYSLRDDGSSRSKCSCPH